jgi:cell division protein FtsQ
VTAPTETDTDRDAATVVTEAAPIDPRIRERRLAVRRKQGRRRLRWVVGLVAVVVLFVVGWALLHTGMFSARVITVSGNHPNTSTSAIVAAAGLDGHPPLVSIDPGPSATRVEALPFVATAQVERDWPDGVTVSVTERVPMVMMAGPGTAWSVLDSHGRTLEVLLSQPPGLPELAVYGPRGGVTPPPIGGTLPSGAAAGLAVSRSLPRAFAAQVVSVTQEPDRTLVLGLNSGIAVSLGTDTELNAKYEDVAAIIAHASLVGATTIDVSVPQSPTVGS